MGTYKLARLVAAAAAAGTLSAFAAGPAMASPALPGTHVGWSTVRGPIPQVSTDSAPGLTKITFPGSSKDHYLITWRGRTTNGVFYKYTTGSSPKNWKSQLTIPSAKTAARPSAAGYGHHVVITWEGASGAGGIWFSVGTTHRSGSITWTAQKSIPSIATSAGPTVFKARYSNILILTYKGHSSDSIYYELGSPTTTGILWAGQHQLPNGALAVTTPTVAEVKTGSSTGRVYVFWRGSPQTRPFFETTTDPVSTSPTWSTEIGFPFSIGTSGAPSAAPAGKNGTFPLVVTYSALSSSHVLYVTINKSNTVTKQRVVPKVSDSDAPELFGDLLLEVQSAGQVDYSTLK